MRARAALVVLLLAAASPARAEFPVAADLGLRVGFGAPFGDVSGGNQPNHLSDNTSGQIPFWLDLGARIYRRVSAGLYLSVGPALPHNCPNDTSCSGVDFRIGAQGAFHFFPRGVVDPWVGLGIGYELLHLSASTTFLGQPVDATESVTGFDFNFQLGVDYRASQHVGIGVFLAFLVGQYQNANGTLNNFQGSGDIKNPVAHEWLFIGLRVLWTS